MAIRRTREDRQQARIRREQSTYTWKPKRAAKAVKPQKIIDLAESDKPSQAIIASETSYFQRDVRRTFIALAVIVLLLFLALVI